MVYIRGFVDPTEAKALLDLGDPLFVPSRIGNFKEETSVRLSTSATLFREEPVVDCIAQRALDFQGGAFNGTLNGLQLVRYTKSQKFNPHFDWYEGEGNRDAEGKRYNRRTSFFVFLEATDDLDGGQTYFPEVTSPQTTGLVSWEQDILDQPDEEHPGLRVKPIVGNAIFWVNLHANGTGDERTLHAGLPVTKGRKTAMNIWPRYYL